MRDFSEHFEEAITPRTRQSVLSQVRSMKAAGHDKNTVAKKLMTGGGIDADHLGHAITKIFGKKAK